MMNDNILETIRMIEEQKLDIRTVTMGISLLDCADSDGEVARRKIYEKITTRAANLVSVCEGIEAELGIPIVNKRIAVTPIALVAGASDDEDYVEFARTLDAAAKAVGVNFVGGFSALVDKGMTPADEKLIRSIPRALAETDVVCSSVDIGSSRAGINMSAVKLMGEYFTMIMHCSFNKDEQNLIDLQEAMVGVEREQRVQIRIQAESIFKAMHTL